MIQLKKVETNNMTDIHHLQKLAFKKLYDKYNDTDSPYNESEDSLIEKWQRPNNYFFLIKKLEKIVGYIRVITNDNQTEANFSQIGIDPEYDGFGYGTQAVLLLEKEFPTVENWSLTTILQEEKLIHFYSKLGYKKTGQSIPIQENMDIVIFVKVTK